MFELICYVTLLKAILTGILAWLCHRKIYAEPLLPSVLHSCYKDFGQLCSIVDDLFPFEPG